jgi:hypothetical protein
MAVKYTVSERGNPLKFNASLIKGGKVVFRPGIDIKEMQKNLKYEKI